MTPHFTPLVCAVFSRVSRGRCSTRSPRTPPLAGRVPATVSEVQIKAGKQKKSSLRADRPSVAGIFCSWLRRGSAAILLCSCIPPPSTTNPKKQSLTPFFCMNCGSKQKAALPQLGKRSSCPRWGLRSKQLAEKVPVFPDGISFEFEMQSIFIQIKWQGFGTRADGSGIRSAGQFPRGGGNKKLSSRPCPSRFPTSPGRWLPLFSSKNSLLHGGCVKS